MRPTAPRSLRLAALGLACALASPAARAWIHGAQPVQDASSEGEQLFADEVLPLLQSQCFRCHGPDESVRVKGGLRMKGRESLLTGGESGPAIVSGDPEASLLARLVRYEDSDRPMPPKRRLPAESVAALERWIELGAPWPGGEAPPPEPEVAPEDARFFEQRIRPVLAENCFECHGSEVAEPKSGFRMAGLPGLLLGGERGPALVPGDPGASRLIAAVRYERMDLRMPPGGKLEPQEIADLEQWIRSGAPWPDYTGTAAGAAAHEGIDLEAGRRWWSFQALVSPPVPDAGEAEVRNPIDAFVSSALQLEGLAPVPVADRRVLVRRAYFDLLGLAPSFEEVEAFAADERSDAWERLIDELLERPGYGERWGRHWLDVVRFAQTNGYERDVEKPYAWRYRDYVIRAFRQDLPYDRFLMEQLAGDELDDRDQDSLVATGFYRIGLWDDEPADPAEGVYDEMDDVLRVIGEGMLGLTIGCARCHDHKFDPLPQEDYYRMLALIRSVRPYENARFALSSSTLAPLDDSPEALRKWRGEHDAWSAAKQQELDELKSVARGRVLRERMATAEPGTRAAFETTPSERTPEQSALVAAVLDDIDGRTLNQAFDEDESRRAFELSQSLEDAEGSFEGRLGWALVAKEGRREPEPTHLLIRGRANSPGPVVTPGFPQVLAATTEASHAVPRELGENERSTGQRRALAEWIASESNPLTARVMVNRVWQQHFGRGLVATPNDFGKQGTLPSHPELLDWLAADFVEHGWSVKHLHRTIMNSATYQRSSQAPRDPEQAAAIAEVDPNNEWLWRQNPRRLEAEAIRDTALQVAGTLNRQPGGRGFFPRLSREAMSGSSRPGKGWELSPESQQQRRSLYAFVKRSMLVPLLETFDFPPPALPTGKRSTTTLATQALVLLNSDFMNRTAADFAARVRAEAGDELRAQVVRAFELALSRPPTEAEVLIAESYVVDQARAFAATTPRLRFRPSVPLRLDVEYIAQLRGEDLLSGPREGWDYAKGLWGNLYNATRSADPERGVVALLASPRLGVGTLEARLCLRAGCESGSLLFRGALEDDVFVGLELRFTPEQGLELLRHGEDVASVASAAAPLERDRWYDVRVALSADRVRVWLDGTEQPLLEAPLASVAATGSFGVRAVGELVELEAVRLQSGTTLHEVLPDDPGPPAIQALESLCLSLLNLNEFVYVD